MLTLRYAGVRGTRRAGGPVGRGGGGKGERGRNGGTARRYGAGVQRAGEGAGEEGDEARRAERKRDLAHCKAGDDNRLTSALSSSGSQQLVGNAINIRNYATSPARHPPSPGPAASVSPECRRARRFLNPPSLPPPSCRRTRFNEITCHRDICALFPPLSLCAPRSPFFPVPVSVLLTAKENPGDATVTSPEGSGRVPRRTSSSV